MKSRLKRPLWCAVLVVVLTCTACGPNGSRTPTAPSNQGGTPPAASAPPTEPNPGPDTGAIALSALTLDPSFVGGQSSPATVTLSGPAPDGGIVIALASSRSEASVPEAVTVAAGETSATFTIASQPVDEPITVQITASHGGGQLVAETIVRPVESTAPILTAIDPPFGRRGYRVGVTLTGSGFVEGQTTITAPEEITFDTVVVTSSTTIKAELFIDRGATITEYPIAVTTPGGTSNAVRFTVYPFYASGSQTFSFTGGMQNFVVPEGVTAITIEAYGAQGGSINVLGATGTGGLGAYVKATVPVQPGSLLRVAVGGAGEEVTGSSAGAGGFNGGGSGGTGGAGGLSLGGAGGGGASSVAVDATATLLVVAGGGGGAGGGFAGAHGGAGGLVAGNGTGVPGNHGLPGGGGNTPLDSNGSGGAPFLLGSPGTPGVANSGGQGGDGFEPGGDGGGGGGGGYRGGGGGGGGDGELLVGPPISAIDSSGGGGGGGSSFVIGAGADVTHQTGVRSGNGLVIISW